MDRVRYDYHIVDASVPRLVSEDLKTYNFVSNVYKSGPLFRVVRALAKARPDWDFILTGSSKNKCRVEHIGEVLGSIEFASGKFDVASPKIREIMNRKSYMQTKDEKKCIRLVIEYMRPTPPERLWASASQEALNALSRMEHQQMTSAWYQIYNNKDDIASYLRPLAQDIQKHVPQFDADAYIAALDKAEASKVVISKWGGSNSLMVVRLGGGRYAMAYDAQFWDVYCDADLSEDIAEALGALKLMDKGTVMANYGYRHSDDVFILTPRKTP